MSERQEHVQRVARLARERGLQVAVAESLTSGAIASALGAGPEASDWFVGGVVAYTARVKQQLLHVRPGPVVTAACAEQMVRGVLAATGADVGAAATGVGGPDASEGEPPGTVYVSVGGPHDALLTHRLDLTGDPEEVLAETVDRVIATLAEALDELPGSSA